MTFDAHTEDASTRRPRFKWGLAAAFVLALIAAAIVLHVRARSHLRTESLVGFSRAVRSNDEDEIARATRALADNGWLADGLREWIESIEATVVLGDPYRIVSREAAFSEALVTLLDPNESSRVRRTAITWLALTPWNEIEAERPAAFVEKLAGEDEDNEVRGNALTLAAHWNPGERVRSLAGAAIESKDDVLRLYAVAALVRCSPDDPRVIAAFEESIHSEAPGASAACQTAAFAMQEQGMDGSRFEEDVIMLLRTPERDLQLRGLQLKAMFDLQTVAVLRELQRMLHDNLVAQRDLEHGGTTYFAINHLASYGERARPCVPDLLLAGMIEDLRGIAESALEEIDPEALGELEPVDP